MVLIYCLDGVPVNITVSGKSSLFVLKLDSATGNLTWTWVQPFCNDNPTTTAMSIDSIGNIIVVGYFAATMNFSGNINCNRFTRSLITTLIAANVQITSYGLNDIMIFALDKFGDFLYAEHFGGTDYDIPGGVAVSNAGIFFAGYFQNVSNFNGGD